MERTGCEAHKSGSVRGSPQQSGVPTRRSVVGVGRTAWLWCCPRNVNTLPAADFRSLLDGRRATNERLSRVSPPILIGAAGGALEPQSRPSSRGGRRASLLGRVIDEFDDQVVQQYVEVSEELHGRGAGRASPHRAVDKAAGGPSGKDGDEVHGVARRSWRVDLRGAQAIVGRWHLKLAGEERAEILGKRFRE